MLALIGVGVGVCQWQKPEYRFTHLCRTKPVTTSNTNSSAGTGTPVASGQKTQTIPAKPKATALASAPTLADKELDAWEA